MSACEKCWSDAFAVARTSGKSQANEYKRLLGERRDTPCTPEEQAGQFKVEPS